MNTVVLFLERSEIWLSCFRGEQSLSRVIPRPIVPAVMEFGGSQQACLSGLTSAPSESERAHGSLVKC